MRLWSRFRCPLGRFGDRFLEEILDVVARGDDCGFVGVFEGVLGEWVFWVWFFGGEVVVECVVDVVR